MDDFADKMNALHHRLGELHQKLNQSKLEERPLETPEELRVALEELAVTEEELRRQNEELLESRHALEVQARRYQELFQFAPDGYLITDPAGNIREANHAAAELFGVRADLLAGKPLITFIAREDRSQFRQLLIKMPRAREVLEWSMAFQPRDRERLDAALRVGAVRDADDNVVALRWMVRDVTDRSRLERTLNTLNEQLEHRVAERTAELANANRANEDLLRREQAAHQEARRAASAKDDFLAALSHELRTPLTPVLAAVSAMENRANIPDPIRPMMEMMRRNIELEARLIDDLLDLTRVSRGKIELALETLDVHAILRSVLEIVSDDFTARQLHPAIELRAREHHVSGDPTRLQQVFWNLLKNSTKFTRPGGNIVVHTSNDQAGRLRIAISDDGIGWDPEVTDRLFQAFQQATGGKRLGGLGLGLAISKALVEAQGGQITAASPGKNRGATFTVELPTVPKPAPLNGQAAPVQTLESQYNSVPALRILLVEDHPDTNQILSQLLSSFGHHVQPAASADEAMKLAAANDFDLLISDIGLPDRSGLEMIAALRQIRPGLRAIALSGYGTDEDVRKSLRAGFAFHLTKPLDFEKLLSAIGELAARSGDVGICRNS